MEKVVALIKLIKSVQPGLKIRVDSNGTDPSFIAGLSRLNLVDGVCLDVKFPFLLSSEEERIKKYMKSIGERDRGRFLTLASLMSQSVSLLDSLVGIGSFDKSCCLLRSVSYPFYDEFDVSLLRETVKEFVLHVDFTINPFYKKERLIT